MRMHFVWLLVAVLMTLGLSGIGYADTTTGLVAHWNFDEDSGYTVSDNTGRGNTGTLNGDVSLGGPGISGNAISFGSGDGYVEITEENGDDAHFDTNDFTVSFWAKTSMTTAATLFSTRNTTSCSAASGPFVAGGLSSGKPQLQVRGDDSQKIGTTAISQINDNQWHLIVSVRQQNMLYVYVDGAIEASVSIGEHVDFSTTLNFLIGRSHYCSGEPYEGNIDDLRIYNRALSASDVAELASSGPVRARKTFGIFIGKNTVHPWLKPIFNWETIKAYDDAKEVRDTMVESGVIASKDDTMLLETVIGPSIIEGALDLFDIRSGDLIIFFFSGHGGESENFQHLGETTLSEGDEFIASSGLVYDDDLYKILHKYPNTYRWVILDSCHSGGFHGNMEETGGDLERLGRLYFAAAAKENRVTFAHPLSGRGILSNILIKGMTKENGYMAADEDKNNKISTSEWSNYFNNKPWYEELIGTQAPEKSLGDVIIVESDMVKFTLKSSPDFDIELGGYSASSVLSFMPAILSKVDKQKSKNMRK